MWGVRGRALSHPRLPALWGGCRGPLPTGCGCGGLRASGPVTNPPARALASWLCALSGRHEGARAGRLLPGCGKSGVGRSSNPDCPPSGRAAGAHYPMAVRAGGCGRGDPSPIPERALLRAGFAPCGGGTRAPGGGASRLGVGSPGSGALPSPTARPLGGLPGPTSHWLWVRGAAGVGTRHQPLSASSCMLSGRHEGARGGRLLPGCGASGVGALPPPTARPLGGLPGPTTHWLWVRGAAGVGTRHQPLSGSSCMLWGRHEGARGGASCLGVGRLGLALSTPNCPPSGRAAGAHYPLAVGAGGCGRGDPSPIPQRALLRAGFARCGGGMRLPGGAPLAWVWGVRGRALSQPRLPALWAGCQGPLRTGCGCGGVRAWGPVTNPTARARASWLCALWGRHEGARGGRLLPGCGASGVGCSPGPRLPALWAGCRGPLATGCGCGGVRVWGPVTNPPARALASCLCALWGRHEGARGGPSCLGVRRPGSGALPPPTARPPGGLQGPTTHWLWVRGVAGVGTRHQPHCGRSCELALRAVGAA